MSLMSPETLLIIPWNMVKSVYLGTIVVNQSYIHKEQKTCNAFWLPFSLECSAFLYPI